MSTSETSVPNVTITDTGIETPTAEEILSGVLQDFNQSFGNDLNITNVASPQYVLASEITQAIMLQNAGMAFTLSQFDPATAIGRFQDAIGRIYFIERKQGTATVVSCTCTGIPTYTLPKGSKAQDDDGNIYSSIADATFNSLGQATVEFENDEVGAIACPAGSLTHIYETVYGWDAITNESAGVAGDDIESRAAFEARRYGIVAKNGRSSLSAVYGSIFSLDNVIDVYVTENSTSTKIYVGTTNYEIAPYSIYVCVVGGDNEEIGLEIMKNKTVGAGTVGNTEVTVYDPNLGENSPAYTYKFQRPTFVPIHFKVEISNDTRLPTDVESLVKDAVYEKFLDDLNNQRYGIGGSVYASRFVGAITDISEYIDVADINVSSNGTTWVNYVTVGVDQMPTIDESNITIVIS